MRRLTRKADSNILLPNRVRRAGPITRVFARELRGRAICVNAVAPGPVAPERFPDGKTGEQVGHFGNMPPQCLRQPGDIAGLVSFLAGPDGGSTDGQALRANGGIVRGTACGDGRQTMK